MFVVGLGVFVIGVSVTVWVARPVGYALMAVGGVLAALFMHPSLWKR
jgi:hypothetical protein